MSSALLRAFELERQAAELWGRQAQAFMVCEEAGELTTAICQFGRDRINANELLDEAADGVIVSVAAAFLRAMERQAAHGARCEKGDS